MEILNPKETMQQSLMSSCSFDSYRKTLDLETNIATDEAYQKNFTNYYRVRRDGAWLSQYYQFMEQNKHNKDITFEEILRYLSTLEHSVRKTAKNPSGKATSVEVSFASKMLATINADHPVWDSQVLRFLNIKVPEIGDREEKIQMCIDMYAQLELEIAEFIKTDAGKKCVEVFDDTFPGCKDFSVYKKMDFYLWNLGK